MSAGFSSSSSSSSSSSFAPTRWTLVLRARGETPESRVALGELCEAYYQPVLRFLQREGRDEEAARELTQDFFARILGNGAFEQADPERGRFRSYVLGALKHFLADQRKHEHRIKRGGGAVCESLDALADSAAGPVAEGAVVEPAALFDREWAMAVMARALEVLRKEFATAGRSEHFDTLKPWLMGEVPSLSQETAARRLGLSEGAVKVGIHRLRKRFRDVVRAEIAQTLRDPSRVDEELGHLIEALS